MTDKSNKAQATVITIVLPPAGEDKRASLAIKQGELGHVSSFQHSDFANLCRVLNTGLSKFVAVQENPPGDVKSVAQKVTSKAKAKDKSKSVQKDKSAGKPPYHLLDAKGNRRELIVMTDPFDVQEKCLKNRKMVFDELSDADEIAQLLVDGGEITIKIVYKNGKTAKVIGQINELPPSRDESDAQDELSTNYPEGIHNKTQEALCDHLEDVERVLVIYNEVNKIKKHDWTNNLMKQREVKGAIHKHVDETDVEAIYDIFFTIDHVADVADNDADEGDGVEPLEEEDTNEKQAELI